MTGSDQAERILASIARHPDRLPEHGGLAEFYINETLREGARRGMDMNGPLAEVLAGPHTLHDLAAVAARLGCFEHLPARSTDQASYGWARKVDAFRDSVNDLPPSAPACVTTPLFQIGPLDLFRILLEGGRHRSERTFLHQALQEIAVRPAPLLGYSRLFHVLASDTHAYKIQELTAWTEVDVHGRAWLSTPEPAPPEVPDQGVLAARLEAWTATCAAFAPDRVDRGGVEELLFAGGSPVGIEAAHALRRSGIVVREVTKAELTQKMAKQGGPPRTTLQAVYSSGSADEPPTILVRRRDDSPSPKAPPLAWLELLTGVVHELVHAEQDARHGDDWKTQNLVAAEWEAYGRDIQFMLDHGVTAEYDRIAGSSGYGWPLALRNSVERAYLGWNDRP